MRCGVIMRGGAGVAMQPAIMRSAGMHRLAAIKVEACSRHGGEELYWEYGVVWMLLADTQ